MVFVVDEDEDDKDTAVIGLKGWYADPRPMEEMCVNSLSKLPGLANTAGSS